MNPEPSGYLAVDHFMSTIGIMVVLGMAVVGFLWKEVKNQAKVSAADRSSVSEKLDKIVTDIETKENILRTEFTQNDRDRRAEILDLYKGKKI